jgi:ribosomal-protein-alanine N-acetyltransferase
MNASVNLFGWPVTLRHGEIVLRPLGMRDAVAWHQVRAANNDWLVPWEATSPVLVMPPKFRSYVRTLRAQARQGTALPFVLEYGGELAGQVTVASITYGAMWSGSIGYWIAQSLGGRGIIPVAVAMVVDYCFDAGLHRLEINVRPENTASLRVVAKLGFREEGIRQRYLHINGDWRDHRTFALTREEVVGRLMDQVPAVK